MDETFIMASHEIDFVREICDRVALMRARKIIRIGPTAQMPAGLFKDKGEESAYLWPTLFFRADHK